MLCYAPNDATDDGQREKRMKWSAAWSKRRDGKNAHKQWNVRDNATRAALAKCSRDENENNKQKTMTEERNDEQKHFAVTQRARRTFFYYFFASIFSYTSRSMCFFFESRLMPPMFYISMKLLCK